MQCDSDLVRRLRQEDWLNQEFGTILSNIICLFKTKHNNNNYKKTQRHPKAFLRNMNISECWNKTRQMYGSNEFLGLPGSLLGKPAYSWALEGYPPSLYVVPCHLYKIIKIIKSPELGSEHLVSRLSSLGLVKSPSLVVYLKTKGKESHFKDPQHQRLL